MQQVACVADTFGDGGVVKAIQVDTFDNLCGGNVDNLVGAVQGLHESIDIEQGPLLRAAVISSRADPSEQRVAIVVHHLVMDGVSQRILLDDLTEAVELLSKDHKATMLPVASSSSTFSGWCSYTMEQVVPRLEERPDVHPWKKTPSLSSSSLGDGCTKVLNTEAAAETILIRFTEEETRKIFSVTGTSGMAYGTPISSPLISRFNATEVFLAALAQASDSNQTEQVVDLEGHGRDVWDDLWEEAGSSLSETTPTVDLSHTVGWFTAMYPVRIALPSKRKTPVEGSTSSLPSFSADEDVLADLLATSSALRQLPDRRSLYSLRRLADGTFGDKPASKNRMLFNFLGFFGQREGEEAKLPWQFVFDPEVDATWSATVNLRSHEVIIDGMVVGASLHFTLSYCPLIDEKLKMDSFAAAFKKSLLEIVQSYGAKQQHWSRLTVALADPAEVPWAPPLPPSSAAGQRTSKCLQKSGSVENPVFQHAMEEAQLSTGDTQEVLVSLFFETLRRFTNSSPEAKPIAMVLLGEHSIGHAFPLAQPRAGLSQLSVLDLTQRLQRDKLLVQQSKICLSDDFAQKLRSIAERPVVCQFLSIDGQASSASYLSGERLEAVTVFCLHYAGGNASLFNSPTSEWQSNSGGLRGTAQIIGIELPGHGSRRDEMPLNTAEALSQDVIRTIQAHQEKTSATTKKYCLLGYSFGALVMFEVAKRLTSVGEAPLHLFVAAEAAPADLIPVVDPVRAHSKFQTFDSLLGDLFDMFICLLRTFPTQSSSPHF